VTRSAIPLPEQFFARDTAGVARDLVGCVLESRIGGRRTAGRVVETEAYVGPHDPAAHGFGGRRTRRNQGLFGPPGTAYVFRSHGIHWCVNAVTERDGYPAAVLIRALEPIAGLDEMRRRRGLDAERLLCAGPGRLTQALGISDAQDGTSLRRGPLRLLAPPARSRITVAVGPRIGIARAADWPLRFVERGSPYLSRRG
jgi:DNA-3-methyladenine glycosylase